MLHILNRNREVYIKLWLKLGFIRGLIASEIIELLKSSQTLYNHCPEYFIAIVVN